MRPPISICRRLSSVCADRIPPALAGGLLGLEVAEHRVGHVRLLERLDLVLAERQLFGRQGIV